MKKRILSFLLMISILSTLFSALPITASATTSGTCGENLTWTFGDEGTLTISGTGDMSGFGKWMHVPWKDLAGSINSIVVEEGVTSMSRYAFDITVESIYISSTVQAVPTDLGAVENFIVSDENMHYASLEGCLFNKNISELIRYATRKQSAIYTVPDGVEIIYEAAFGGSSYLEKIVIPSTVQSFGRETFAYCSNLSCVEINAKAEITALPTYCFEGCSSLVNITLPSSITTIGEGAFARCSSLENISFPESLTTIKSGAFSDCENLSNIIIPNSLYEIGRWAFNNTKWLDSQPDGIVYAGNVAYIYKGTMPSDTKLTLKSSTTGISPCSFSGQDELTSITIPQNVKYIGDEAFSSCDKLSIVNYYATNCTVSYASDYIFKGSQVKTINIGGSVQSIPSGLFAYCQMEEIIIPSGVISIGRNAFYYCRRLKSVSVSNNLTYIAMQAFYECSAIADVYYSGTKEQWKSIEFQKQSYTNKTYNECLTNANIHYNEELPDPIEYLPPIVISNGIFNFSSGKGTANFDYDDYYFKNSAYSYNHDLAKASMRLALSAFATKNVETQYENAEDLLRKMGFLSIEHNDWYEKEPERNSIGVITGRKHIIYPDGNYTLIAVAVRGGGYENEWGGNFNVGSDNHHAGFATARDQVVEFIKDYHKDQRIGGNIKLWITGYSRAAATTNLTAAYFDENPNSLGSMVTLTPENIYAYCFEAPAGVVNPNNESGLYNNIFSIVNQHDFVPMVAMRKWGYDRYGITKYFPSAQTNSDYYGLRKDMLDYFAQYHKSDYKVDDFTYYYTFASNKNLLKNGYGTQGVYLEKTIDKLAENIGNPSNYENEFQEMFEYIGENIVGLGKTEELANSLLDEMKSRSLLYLVEGTYLVNPNTWVIAGTAYLTTRSAVKDAFENIGISVSSDAVDTLVGLIIDLGFDNVYTLLQNTSGIAQGHYPELCMAWLDAIDEDDFSDKRLRTLYLNCPVDMEIYDSNNNLVAAVHDNVPQKIDGSAIVPFIDENGQKIVYLPQDEEYRIEVIATDDGEVTYSVQEKDINTGSTKVINYNNMSVKKDDTLTGTAENLKSTEIATYMLSSNSVEVSEAEVFEDAEPITVETNATGNGVVSNGGEYYKGEFAEVVATPAENEEFSGWYNGETLVSNDAAYRFQVAEAITLTAKFTENSCEVIFLDDEDDVISTQRIVKGTTVEIPEAPVKSGYRFDGFYKDNEYTTAITEGDVYTENTTLYAKYTEPSYSNGFYYFPIDYTTAEIVGYEYNDYEFWIPVSIDGYIVTKISNSAFKDAEFETVLIPDTITEIGANAFEGCDYLETINYIGTEAQWNAITIGENNDALINANKVFEYSEDVVYGRFRNVDFSGSSVEGSLRFDYVYKNCVAIIDIINYDDEIEKTLEVEIPAGTEEKEFTIPFEADDKEHEIYVSFVNNTTEKIELCYGDRDYFYAEKERYTDGDWTYALVGENAEVLGYTGDSTALVIPGTLGGYTVTGIGDYALEYGGFTAVAIPDTVTYIGEYALYGSEITEITLPPNLMHIGEGAFAETQLKSIVIPASVTEIGEYAFDYCFELANITVDVNNLNYCSVDGNLYSKDKTELIKYASGKTANTWAIPNTVTTIKEGALADGEHLNTVTIPGSVTTIESYAFSGGAWETLNIPASVIDIGDCAFMYCRKLKEINVDNGNANYHSENGVLLSKDKTVLLQYPIGMTNSTYIVPDGVKTISAGAFARCTLETIQLPTALVAVEDGAFRRCETLQTVLYKGTSEAYFAIDFTEGNDALVSANILFGYTGMPASIKSVYCRYDDNTVTANIIFNYIEKAGTLYLAVYDAQGSLIALEDRTITTNEFVYTIEMAATESYKDYTVKAFYWEGQSPLNPLAKAIETEITEAVLVDDVLESTHFYENNMDETKTYIYNGDCVSIDVTFSVDTETESGFDYIYIYDVNDNVIGKYDGRQLAGRVINVPGNTVKIRLTSDDSYTEYGYRTESIVVNK